MTVDEPQMEQVETDTGQLVWMHAKVDCIPPCAFHAPSDHPMNGWPLRWRDDVKGWERVCPTHHTGHPDPDWVEFERRHVGLRSGAHGCCGCEFQE